MAIPGLLDGRDRPAPLDHEDGRGRVGVPVAACWPPLLMESPRRSGKGGGLVGPMGERGGVTAVHRTSSLLSAYTSFRILVRSVPDLTSSLLRGASERGITMRRSAQPWSTTSTAVSSSHTESNPSSRELYNSQKAPTRLDGGDYCGAQLRLTADIVRVRGYSLYRVATLRAQHHGAAQVFRHGGMERVCQLSEGLVDRPPVDRDGFAGCRTWPGGVGGRAGEVGDVHSGVKVAAYGEEFVAGHLDGGLFEDLADDSYGERLATFDLAAGKGEGWRTVAPFDEQHPTWPGHDGEGDLRISPRSHGRR